MQIHELSTFSGTPSASDYLAVDTGSETFKISANAVGITKAMTAGEARTGTSTEQMTISPKTLNDQIDTSVITLFTSLGWSQT